MHNSFQCLIIALRQIHKYKFLIISLVWSIMINDAIVAQENAKEIYPSEKWEYLEADNPCEEMISVKNFIRDSLNTTGFVLVQGGKIRMSFGDVGEISYLASSRKSVLSMLYGKYVKNTTVKLDVNLAQLGINDVNKLTEREKQASIDQIINSRSGIYLPASNAGSDPNMPKRGSNLPGEQFVYNNWDFNVAGTILEQLVEKDIYEIFQEDIAIPLGLEDFDMAKQEKYGDSTISIHPAYHFYLSTRDMARLGYLMLRNGNWNGQQIIPSKWVEKTTTKVSTAPHGNLINGYSYMWWLYDDSKNELLEGAYTSSGAFGQYITVIPKLDIVIAHKTKDVYQRMTGIFDYDRLIQLILDEYDSRNDGPIDQDKYTGIYTEVRNGQTFEYEISNTDGQLWLGRNNINPYKERLFLCSKNKGILNFGFGQELDVHFSFTKSGVIEYIEINKTKRYKQ